MLSRTFRCLPALAIALAVVAVPAVQAQTARLHLGPRVSYQFDLEEFGLGAQFSAPIARNLEFYPSVDIFLVDRGSALDLNADFKYRLPTTSANWLYVGAGLNLARRKPGENSRTDAGINAFVGAESLGGSVHPFGEFRFTANNGSTGQLSVGLNFTL